MEEEGISLLKAVGSHQCLHVPETTGTWTAIKAKGEKRVNKNPTVNIINIKFSTLSQLLT